MVCIDLNKIKFNRAIDTSLNTYLMTRIVLVEECDATGSE